MKNIFIDTNILLDLLTDRKPFSDHTEELLGLTQTQKIKVYVSAISFNNIYYIIRKANGHKSSIQLIKEMRELVNIMAVGEDIIDKALASDFHDFEDAIQYFSAVSNKNIEAIITRNSKDFKSSDLPVLSSHEACRMIKK
jgi:predicted nucleic acid-binding protein